MLTCRPHGEPLLQPCRVVAVDVGSVRGKFAWAALDMPGFVVVGAGPDPEGAARCGVAGLDAGLPTALGFEAPLSLPVPVATDVGWLELGRARRGEGNRSWSAGAGSGALATGLVEMAWLCRRVTALSGGVVATTQPSRWREGIAALLLWEAFVSGAAKPAPRDVGQHAADAGVAAETFGQRWATDQLDMSDVDCQPHEALSLAWTAARHGGLVIDDDEAGQLPRIYRTPVGVPTE